MAIAIERRAEEDQSAERIPLFKRQQEADVRLHGRIASLCIRKVSICISKMLPAHQTAMGGHGLAVPPSCPYQYIRGPLRAAQKDLGNLVNLSQFGVASGRGLE